MLALARVDNLSVTHIYETYYGYVEITIRIGFAAWFLSELKKTFSVFNGFDNYSVLAGAKHAGNGRGGGGAGVAASFNSRKFAEEIDELNQYYVVEGQQAAAVAATSPPRSPVTPDALMLSSMVNVKQRIKVFYLHFGAWSLVWFIYLPVLVFISNLVSELFRFRLFISKLENLK